jgi:hypothetical protein
VGGHLAVEDDELVGGRRAEHLALVIEQGPLDARGREAFEPAAKHGLALRMTHRYAATYGAAGG